MASGHPTKEELENMLNNEAEDEGCDIIVNPRDTKK
jgi:hypothetical protein